MPRPRKLTKTLQEQICALLKDGLFRRHAAAKVGIDETTFSRWFHKGLDDGKGLYFRFYLAVQHAEAEFAEICNTTIRTSGAHHPKLVQWLLSRRFPELYGRRDNVEEVKPEDKNAQAQAIRTLLIERLERLFPDAPQVEPEAPKPEAAAPTAGATDGV